MAAKRLNDERPHIPRRRPATTPEGREQQMINMAIDFAEEAMLSGNASSQVVTHYLKLASSTERLAQEKLKQENELLKAKIESLKSAKRVEELYEEAIKAMRTYAGQPDPQDFEEDDYYDDY